MKQTAQHAPHSSKHLQEEILSSSLPQVRTRFICECCDYRWNLEVDTVLEDSYADAAELHRTEPHVSCPICGSHEINPDED